MSLSLRLIAHNTQTECRVNDEPESYCKKTCVRNWPVWLNFNDCAFALLFVLAYTDVNIGIK